MCAPAEAGCYRGEADKLPEPRAPEPSSEPPFLRSHLLQSHHTGFLLGSGVLGRLSSPAFTCIM